MANLFFKKVKRKCVTDISMEQKTKQHPGMGYVKWKMAGFPKDKCACGASFCIDFFTQFKKHYHDNRRANRAARPESLGHES